MQQTEKTARELCAIDLKHQGFSEDRIPALVDKFWPVIANEIRQGIADGEWTFSADYLGALTEEYRALVGQVR